MSIHDHFFAARVFYHAIQSPWNGFHNPLHDVGTQGNCPTLHDIITVVENPEGAFFVAG